MIKDLSSSLSSTFLDVLASLGSILESDSVNNVFEALVVNIGSQHSYSTFVFHLNSHHVLTQTIVWMDTWTAIKALVVLKINCHLIIVRRLKFASWFCVDLAMIITN